MVWKALLVLLIALIIAGAVVFAVNGARLDRANRQLAQDLLERSVPTERNLPEASELPEPVARYLERALPADWVPRAVRIEQRGEMIQGGTWRPFTAVQNITASPPGFVWDARIRFAPLVNARVIDMYSDGSGALQAKLLGTFTVADAGSTQELDDGELIRYLAEGPWLPSTLLPREDLTWTPIDDRSARATLMVGEDRAQLTFFFDEQGDIVRVEGERPKGLEAGSVETGIWVGRFWNHQERDGVRIPLEGEVAWQEDTGIEPYWRGTVEAVDFDPA